MSINAALSTAVSGLLATQRMAEVVSSNVANAQTDGYGRRSVELSARGYEAGGAVRVVAIHRHVDAAVLSDRRLAMAGAADSGHRSAFLDRVATEFGVPGSGYALADRLAAVEASLVSVSARPDSTSALSQSVDALQRLVGQVGAISASVQDGRAAADAAIARDIATLNATLNDIEGLNREILRQQGKDDIVAGLADQRQVLVDRVSEIVPVRVLDRPQGAIALMSPTGALLLDGKAAQLGFTAASRMAPDMSLAGGSLSGITLNGNPLDISSDRHKLAGGRLAGHLAVRDTLGPAAQADLDAFARDLIERFADPAVDPTLVPGAAGLLTDAGQPFDPASEIGLAGRLALNPAVVPEAGGDVWRLRDGLGAAAPGDPGNGAGLLRLIDALSAPRSVASGSMAGRERSAAGLLNDIQAALGASAVRASEAAAYATARLGTMEAAFAAGGVDTDIEMQHLLLIEQAYAANAQVIDTIETMLDTLLGI